METRNRKKGNGVWEKFTRGRFTITDEFPIRPSWCQAELSLEQIKRGRAKGNKPALVIRSYLQSGLFALGSFIQKFDLLVLIISVLIFVAWAVPLYFLFVLETDIEKLWVPRGGRLESERDFISYARSKRLSALGPAAAGTKHARPMDTSSVSDLSALQVLIQTARNDDETILTRDQLLLHVDVLLNLSQISVEGFGATWTMQDLCFKPRIPVPKSKEGTADVIGDALTGLVPCTVITPLDCFWEGSIPHGPFPPYDKLAGLIPVSWQSLDPQQQLALLSQFKSVLASDDFDTTDVVDMFHRAGITHGYQPLPCIDPLNKKCPKTAPNYIGVCDLVKRFLDWNDLHNEYPEFTRIAAATEKPRNHDYDAVYDIEENRNDSDSSDQGGAFGGLFGGSSPPEEPVECKNYSKAITDLMRANESLAYIFLPNNTWKDYGNYLKGGCRGFAPKFMEWPERLILGGREPKNKSEPIEKVSALQTVIMLATAEDIYNRFAGPNQTTKQKLANWTVEAARIVMKQWQRKYSKTIYNWINNTKGGKRILHPLAAASITDMVEEFSQFNWWFIIIGYGLMILYACLSALSFADRGVRSCVSLALCGCIVVMLANVSGLGFTLLLGISFNATTTQILPFLLLSLGVDEMFLLLDKYREIIRKIKHDEIGVLLRETGLSVLVTYINNVIAFFAGVMLPIPALKVFCVQVAIVLIFNLLAILTIYPAIMALDLRRQRANLVDCLCCVRMSRRSSPPAIHSSTSYGAAVAPVENAYEMEKKSAFKNGASAQGPPPLPVGPRRKAAYKRCTLTRFVRNCYAPVIQNVWVKVGLSMIFVLFFVVAMIGLFRIPIGLELSELIPQDSPPYSFMIAREKYFSFYNIFMIIRGPTVNYADLKTQQVMRNYLDEVRNISYTVKIDLKNDWINLMTDWLKFIEERFKTDWENDVFGPKGWKDGASKASIVAYKLLCNKDGKVDCSQVNGNSTLIRPDGFIEPTLFNKCITAWFSADPMTYYVSQANFHPLPPDWEPRDKSLEIPDAPTLLYTQIPLFIDGVVDTPVTMDMIVKFRAVADKYSAMGLPNFPLGIPFTFWELYVYLTQNVLIAFAIITVVVFAAISLMLLNPWISALIVVVLVFMIVIELGFMGLINIKLNPISAVTLITAVGIRVKFTVHVALSFLTTVGTRNVRIARTLEHMFIPVLHGGVSTLLGLIMLGFCKFEFIVMYYFLIMFALVVLGILGGLILMPVLLSWIGPPAEVIPLDGSDRLEPPVTTDTPTVPAGANQLPAGVTTIT